MGSRLVVSLSGLTADPAALDHAAELVAELPGRGVATSHLYRPRLRDGAAAPAVVGWLRGRRAAGDEIVLHGYDHTPEPIGGWEPVPRPGRRAEFARLPRHEAGLRLAAARRMSAAARLGTDLFAPPRWLVSAATLEALRDLDLSVCADDNAVRLLRSGQVVRSRVLGFRASGERLPVAEDRRAAETWRGRLLVREAAGVARRGGLVRLALRAKDLHRPVRVAAALAAVDAALALGARPTGYGATTARAGAA